MKKTQGREGDQQGSQGPEQPDSRQAGATRPDQPTEEELVSWDRGPQWQRTGQPTEKQAGVQWCAFVQSWSRASSGISRCDERIKHKGADSEPHRPLRAPRRCQGAGPEACGPGHRAAAHVPIPPPERPDASDELLSRCTCNPACRPCGEQRQPALAIPHRESPQLKVQILDPQAECLHQSVPVSI